MDIPADLQRRIDLVLAGRESYVYKGEVLADKVIVGLLAPTAVGKSTLANECLRHCKERGVDAGEIGTITTRQRRVGSDPANYVTATEGVTFESFVSMIEKGALINWSVHGTGHLYGTAVQSLGHEYNLSPLFPASLPMVKKAGFRSVVSIYLTIPTSQWQRQLGERISDPKFTGRMQEAVESLKFAKNNLKELIILSNTDNDGDLSRNAARIVDHMTTGLPLLSDDTAISYIDEMLAYAQEVVDGNT